MSSLPWSILPKDRLCQEVMGEDYSSSKYPRCVVDLPIIDADISLRVLEAATEAISAYKPPQFRQVLPYVLHHLENGNSDVLKTNFVEMYLTCVNREFTSDVGWSVEGRSCEYRTDFKTGHIAKSISAFSSHELDWARTWTADVYTELDEVGQSSYGDGIIMLNRLICMALGLVEEESLRFL